MTSIASLGDVDIDLIMDVGEHPRPGDEVFADTAVTGLGGSAVNTAVWLVRLGFESRVLAQVGDDVLGRYALASLREAGVDTARLAVSDRLPTGMSVLFVTPDGERTMIGLRGANRAYAGSEGWEADCDWLHLSGYALLEGEQRRSALAAVATARDGGLGVSVDVPSGVARALGPQLAATLCAATIVSVGREALSLIFPGSVREPLEAIETLAVTGGAAPFSLYRGGETITVAPPPVDVVDTTGAGDAFVAGLITGILRRHGLGPTAVLAGAMGAAATQDRGAVSARPGTTALEAFLRPHIWPTVDPGWVEEARKALSET